MKIVIVTTLYNAEKYVEMCLFSIATQTHKDFVCYITDDLSTDKSVELVKKYIKNDNRFVLIENREKKYQPGNYDQIIRNNPNIHDDDVIVEVDGDDWLPDSKVLERVYKLYTNKKVWIANGSFIYSTGQKGFSSPQKISSNLRKERFTASHMRTWRTFLWRKIKVDDLKDEDGIHWKVTGDLSFMYPMLEMAGEEHYRFMSDINYVYNEQNPINDHKVDLTLVNVIAEKIRNKEPYTKISR
jgi:glycosyltransferase involved in cell wall biosynthesis